MELREFYDKVRSLTPGTSITHNGLELEKAKSVGDIASPDHSEVTVYNDGSKVESLSLSAMDFDRFESLLDEIADVDPKSIDEWLSRDK